MTIYWFVEKVNLQKLSLRMPTTKNYCYSTYQVHIPFNNGKNPSNQYLPLKHICVTRQINYPQRYVHIC